MRACRWRIGYPECKGGKSFEYKASLSRTTASTKKTKKKQEVLWAVRSGGTVEVAASLWLSPDAGSQGREHAFSGTSEGKIKTLWRVNLQSAHSCWFGKLINKWWKGYSGYDVSRPRRIRLKIKAANWSFTWGLKDASQTDVNAVLHGNTKLQQHKRPWKSKKSKYQVISPGSVGFKQFTNKQITKN